MDGDQPVGQIAYEAYCQVSGNKSLVSGAELPGYEDLPDPIKAAWQAAGAAVLANALVVE